MLIVIVLFFGLVALTVLSFLLYEKVSRMEVMQFNASLKRWMRRGPVRMTYLLSNRTLYEGVVDAEESTTIKGSWLLSFKDQAEADYYPPRPVCSTAWVVLRDDEQLVLARRELHFTGNSEEVQMIILG
ncbi:MAG: hypothetical protein WC030_02815 [Candidatus Paceibacterota bacterium]